MNLKTFNEYLISCYILLMFASCVQPSKNHFCDDIPNDPEHYDMLCSCTLEHSLSLPLFSSSNGKVFKNKAKGYGKFEKGDSSKIDSLFLNSFRKITLDSSNFIWGEIGTAYTDYAIEFYDLNGDKTSYAKISFDGMLDLEPPLGTEKLGHLSNKGDSLLKELMNKYVQK